MAAADRVGPDLIDLPGADAAVDDDHRHALFAQQAKRLHGPAGRDEEHPVDLALDEHGGS